MSYIENPKTRGSGILCAIPQRGTCPVKCGDCFFQGGRSYLEPLDEHLPNLPSVDEAGGRVVRFNDGNDSNNDRETVLHAACLYEDVFLNTAIPRLDVPYPIVFTCNPGPRTDGAPILIEPTPNLMFVRVRTNTWNTGTVQEAVAWYTERNVPVVLTFMAYYSGADAARATEAMAPLPYPRPSYTYRKRTLNSYWVITQAGWDALVEPYLSNGLVYTCGRDANTHACSRCGVCLREYFATKERMR